MEGYSISSWTTKALVRSAIICCRRWKNPTSLSERSKMSKRYFVDKREHSSNDFRGVFFFFLCFF